MQAGSLRLRTAPGARIVPRTRHLFAVVGEGDLSIGDSVLSGACVQMVRDVPQPAATL
jgi:hypothetical protein